MDADQLKKYSDIAFGQCIPSLLLSTWTAQTWIGQYYLEYRWTTNGNQNASDTKIVSVADRFHIHMQISV